MLKSTSLIHAFDPNTLAPGVYMTTSQTPAYPGARFLVESGRAKALERYLPGGHIELTFEVMPTERRNPAAQEEIFERKGTIKLTRKWLEARTKEYSNWRTAWWREAIQNSIDPGTGAASRVELICKANEEGNWIVSCSDNGNGMTRDQVEDEDRGFLVFGGSGKASGSGIGGFGEAKQLLIFPWLQYRLLTADQEYVGRGGDWSARNVPMRRGVMLEVIMPADTHTTPEDALYVLSRSWVPNVTFLLNGKVVATGSPTPSIVLDEVPGEGILYESQKKRGEPPEIMIRKEGLWMFSETLAPSAKHGLIVEVTGKSTAMFTTNRDGFSWNADKLRRKISAAKEEMTSEGKVRAKLKPVERIVRGTGKFGIEEKKKEVPVRAMQVLEAIGTLPPIRNPEGIKPSQDMIDRVLVKLEQFIRDDTDKMMTATPDETAESGVGSAAGLDMLMQMASSSPGSTQAILSSLSIKGQVGMDAAVKQIVWKPDFYMIKDAGYAYTIPKKFTPEDMTPAVLRLLKTWAELCRFILATVGEDAAFGVGFWFSEDADAGYLYRKGEHWLLLDPHKVKRDRKEIYAPTDQQDLGLLWAMALHEISHMLVRIHQGYGYDDDDSPPQPASHGSELANQQTTLQAKLASGWSTVRKIAASIKLRGQVPGSKPAAPHRAPVEPAERHHKASKPASDWDAVSALNRLNSFLYKLDLAIEDQTSENMAAAMDYLADFYFSFTEGTDAAPDASYHSMLRDLIEHERCYKRGVMLFAGQRTPGSYRVSIGLSFEDLGKEVFEVLDGRISRLKSVWEDAAGGAIWQLTRKGVLAEDLSGLEQQNPVKKKSNSREIEYHLEEIDAWRRGDRGSPGQPSTGLNYSGAMLDAIKRHEQSLIDLGHKPTIAYVQAHGFADGQRGAYTGKQNPAGKMATLQLLDGKTAKVKVGYEAGEFIVHSGGNKTWNVTHMPTGKLAAWGLQREHAVALADALAGPWNDVFQAVLRDEDTAAYDKLHGWIKGYAYLPPEEVPAPMAQQNPTEAPVQQTIWQKKPN